MNEGQQKLNCLEKSIKFIASTQCAAIDSVLCIIVSSVPFSDLLVLHICLNITHFFLRNGTKVPVQRERVRDNAGSIQRGKRGSVGGDDRGIGREIGQKARTSELSVCVVITKFSSLQIETFFAIRRSDLAKRRKNPSDLYTEQLHRVEKAILRRRHAEGIKATTKGIRKLEKLMDVKKGTVSGLGLDAKEKYVFQYNFYFDYYVMPKKRAEKKEEEKEKPKERHSLSHFIKPKSSWCKTNTSEALPGAGSSKDTSDL